MWVCDGSDVATYYSGYTQTYQDGWGNITTTTSYNNSWSYSLLHMNWGWGGYNIQTGMDGLPVTNNGWFDCATNITMANAGSLNYNFFQIIVTNINPLNP